MEDGSHFDVLLREASDEPEEPKNPDGEDGPRKPTFILVGGG
jgi:hypothetical protein